MANIASDGTIITLQQNDQLDLNSLQLSTNDASLFLPNLVSTTVKKEIQKCDLCQQILLDSTEHNCKIIEITKEEQQPLPMLFCSFKKCGSTFENQQELEDHMQTYHQPPFSPAKQPSTSSANTVNKPAKKSVKFKVCILIYGLLNIWTDLFQPDQAEAYTKHLQVTPARTHSISRLKS